MRALSEGNEAGANGVGDEHGDRAFLIQVKPGSTIYIDGRFYTCVDRLRMGGHGGFDIVQVARVPLGPDAETTFDTISLKSLSELALQGRAALVATRKPRTDFAFEAPIPTSPTAPATAAAMSMY